MDDAIRIDKWLWAARFYKARSMASKAVDGGKVHVNQQRVKSSHRIKVGDNLVISHALFKQEVIVMALADRRGPAKQAQMLYQETEQSMTEREMVAMQRKILNQGLPRTTRKPGKHERQKIMQMLGKK